MIDHVTFTEYAKRRGVSKMAVSRAVSSGRLVSCVVRHPVDGKVLGVIPEIADQEWEANTDYTDAPHHAPDGDSPALAEGGSLKDASTAQKYWQAKLAEQKYRQEAGELLERSAVEQEWSTILTTVKTRLLGVPSGIRQALPHLTLEDIAVIDERIREALEELADDAG